MLLLASFSTAQMSKFYTLVSDKITQGNLQITKDLVSSPFIFIPSDNSSKCNDVMPGVLLSSKDVYWHDPTGCVDKMMEMACLRASTRENGCLPCKALATVYPGLHDFFVKICGVPTVPLFGSYLSILLQLSTVSLPSQSSDLVSILNIHHECLDHDRDHHYSYFFLLLIELCTYVVLLILF